MSIKNKIKKHIKEIPYEGQEIDEEAIVDTIRGFLKGMITFTHKFTKTSKGYEKDGKYYSRDEIVQMFESRIL